MSTLESALFAVAAVSMIVGVASLVLRSQRRSRARFRLAGIFLVVGLVLVMVGVASGARAGHISGLAWPTESPTGSSSASTALPWVPQASSFLSLDVSTSGGFQLVCGPDAFVNHDSTDPLFKRPDGFTSGWITSDPSDVLLADGNVATMKERFVLVVDNLPEVQILGVKRGSEGAHTWGCWYPPGASSTIASDAQGELEMLKEVSSGQASLYQINRAGLTKLK